MREQDIIREVLSQHPNACVTCSFQAEDMALVHLLQKGRRDIPVLFLDTGYHFAETYAYRDEMTQAWGLNLVNLTAERTVAEQEAEHGQLFRMAPDRCCHLRKVEPLIRGISGYDAWFTGLRREQSPTRANLQEVEDHHLPDGRTIAKVSPLAAWTWSEVETYCDIYEIPVLPLYEQGYTSIGCEPCTALPLDPTNARSGRWGGAKLECGIHTFDKEKA